MADLSAPAALSNTETALAFARGAIEIEIAGLEALRTALAGELGGAFAALIQKIAQCNGRVVVTGMGKSGHVGRKIAATLSSTGTPAFFVHAGEASHGDLGMITAGDVVLALSWSGETPELRDIINYCGRFGIFLAAITSRADSALGRAADLALVLPAAREACPHNLAPTTSTLLQLAAGDAIAVSLLQLQRFSAVDFRNFHPGGKLGASLRFPRDVMHREATVPLAAEGTLMSAALIEMTAKGFGCIGIVDAAGRLAGIVTDGDLRRKMSDDLLKLKVEEVMTKAPRTIDPDSLATEALAILNARNITALFVVDDAGIPLGILHVHDLLRLGVA